jgi:hypothetical protein
VFEMLPEAMATQEALGMAGSSTSMGTVLFLPGEAQKRYPHEERPKESGT